MTPTVRSSAWRGARHGFLLFSLLFCLGLFGRPAPAEGQRSLEIRQFNATLEVLENGDLRVVESIQVRFNGSWNGIYRSIPVEYRTPQRFSYRLFLDLDSVADESGQELKTEMSREGAYRKVKIWVPGAENVTRTISLRYTVPNALKFFEEHDELYWNVTGTEWDVPIQAASALVELPEGVTGPRATAFTGAYGSSAQDAQSSASVTQRSAASGPRISKPSVSVYSARWGTRNGTSVTSSLSRAGRSGRFAIHSMSAAAGRRAQVDGLTTLYARCAAERPIRRGQSG